MTRNNPKKFVACISTTARSCWLLNLLVASGWLLAVASVGILFDDNLALSNHRLGKAAAMAILIGVICWLGGGSERRTHTLKVRS